MHRAYRHINHRQVVTLAGNLDVESWRRRQGYAALRGSLNPADRPPLPKHIRQWHFRGGDDANLPAGPAGSLVIHGVGHATGWDEVFCAILESVGGRCRLPEPG